ncbi:MAG: penicillin-binding protein 2 [Rhodobiaceae bacterium]|nr:penicillin-binding protein 2 [Rhodobiaceae bacterium]MCC0055669.1 penicillin-binding protein 2 [Rhodobiaceae bacterium]
MTGTYTGAGVVDWLTTFFYRNAPWRLRGEQTPARIVLMMAAFLFGFCALGGRLVMLGLIAPETYARHVGAAEQISQARPEILDRNGIVLARDISTPSMYGEPNNILDIDETVERLTAAVPELNAADLRSRLSSDRRFVWLKREMTPAQQAEIHRLGIPGIGFVEENRRFYPSGRTAAHVLGLVNIDNQGIAGMERYIDTQGLAALHQAGFARDARTLEPIRLSIDLRVQHALRDELIQAMDHFKAKAAAAVILDANSGEVMAMVSLPDFDPNHLETASGEETINRMTAGVYELGSAFKAFTVAMALDSGEVKLTDSFDARQPLRIASFTIDDYHATRRILTVPEIFVHSSNIGTAKMALKVGIDGHQEFLKRLGFFKAMHTELPETAEPLLPARWGELSSMTISFGHGMSVQPLQAAAAGAALINGGRLIEPTFLPRSADDAEKEARQVIKPQTSDEMRDLMRLNVEDGTAGKADVPGILVGGKTGTAEKVVNGRYSNSKLLTTFLAGFPMDKPRYAMLLMLDEPEPAEETHGYRTSGWNAVPTAGKIIARVAPMLGVTPGPGLALVRSEPDSAAF